MKITQPPSQGCFSPHKSCDLIHDFLLTHFHFKCSVCMFVCLEFLENVHIVFCHLIKKDVCLWLKKTFVSKLLCVLIFFWNIGNIFLCRFFKFPLWSLPLLPKLILYKHTYCTRRHTVIKCTSWTAIFSNSVTVCECLCVCVCAVSYTHLTLPTTAEV